MSISIPITRDSLTVCLAACHRLISPRALAGRFTTGYRELLCARGAPFWGYGPIASMGFGYDGSSDETFCRNADFTLSGRLRHRRLACPSSQRHHDETIARKTGWNGRGCTDQRGLGCSNESASGNRGSGPVGRRCYTRRRDGNRGNRVDWRWFDGRGRGD